ncbi:MAG: hypothetical protein ACXAC7_18245 [Candidatus Hodarchaeales archaeon]|jgi:hypothetical protein
MISHLLGERKVAYENRDEVINAILDKMREFRSLEKDGSPKDKVYAIKQLRNRIERLYKEFPDSIENNFDFIKDIIENIVKITKDLFHRHSIIDLHRR